MQLYEGMVWPLNCAEGHFVVARQNCIKRSAEADAIGIRQRAHRFNRSATRKDF